MLRFLNDAEVHVTAVATEWRRHWATVISLQFSHSSPSSR